MGYFFVYTTQTPDEVSLSGIERGTKVYTETWQISSATKKDPNFKSKFIYRIPDTTDVLTKNKRQWTKKNVKPSDIEYHDFGAWTPVDELYPDTSFDYLRKETSDLSEEYLGKKGGVAYYQMGGSLPKHLYNREGGKPSKKGGVPGLKKNKGDEQSKDLDKEQSKKDRWYKKE